MDVVIIVHVVLNRKRGEEKPTKPETLRFDEDYHFGFGFWGLVVLLRTLIFLDNSFEGTCREGVFGRRDFYETSMSSVFGFQ